MTHQRSWLLVISAIVLTALLVHHFYADRMTEFNQDRENKAIAFCVDRGGTARFDYATGADRFVLTGCTFSKGQERP